MSAGFVHLHCHSEYSVLDGGSRVKDIVKRCVDFGMSACAITDHGNLFGAIDFYQSAKKAGIKAIIGSELYVAKGSRFDKSAKSSSAAQNHLVLLCENETGYHNLCRLSSLGYLEGFHYRPRVDFELLAQYHEGLIASSACLAGEIPRAVLAGDIAAADAAIERYVGIFGRDNFLLEIMDHGMPEDRQVNPIIAELAAKHGVMLIATNDSHYTDRSDAEAHEALLAIQTNATLDSDKRMRFGGGPEYYFTSAEEMREKFKEYPQALANTVEIASRCQMKIPLGLHLIPEYTPPEGMDKVEYLRGIVQLGLQDRYDGQPSQAHLERADFELSIISQMGFVDYFLVVWDLIAYARRQSIPVGPGRGSGAGSLVAYALEITNIDPMRYGLLFERFLNPERVSMPDFDLDFCERRRGEVIEYVRNKYGSDNVCQIITFGRMKAKLAIRNVGRVLGMAFGEVDRIAKLVPEGPKVTLEGARKECAELADLIKNDPQIGRLWSLATRLEGVINNCGTHAAGVVICDKPLTDFVPLFKAASSDVVATQFEMANAEQVGLLKMDFLGLRTLTVVHDAVRMIKEDKNTPINIDHVEPNDAKTYELLRSGRTLGVFQLESSGMRELAKRIGLESLEEICALVALYRPGPMALKDDYIDNKHHPERLKYDHPLLEPILKETYGIALYQEQVMQIVQAVAGFTLGQADILRRAMGKKKADLMAQQRQMFVDGAKANGIDEQTADTLFQKIEQFAGYGFNKSHSMAYAYVAYQTAFLKANYPAEFMAALLSSESRNLDKIALYVEECRRMGIKVLPPDVNSSGVDFSVENDCIRFGMGAVKNVGEGAVRAIVRERDENGPYEDIYDFCKRVDPRQINSRCLESLNMAGAFASTDWNRSEVEASIEPAMQEGQISQRDREAGQTSLFDLLDEAPGQSGPMHQKPILPEWPESKLLSHEKEMMGLYVSSHPLTKFARVLDNYVTLSLADIEGDGESSETVESERAELREGQEVITGGMIGVVKLHTTAKGKRMAFVTLDTLEGPCELTVFSDLYELKAGMLAPEMPVIVPARVSVRNGEPGLIASDLMTMEEAEERLARAVHIRMGTAGLDKAYLEHVAEILGAQPGPCDVYLHCMTGMEEVVIHANKACRVAATQRLRQEVENFTGDGAVWFSGGRGLPRHPN